jgi:hypothetical protein
VRRAARTIRRELQTDDLVEARAFDELTVAGRASAKARIPSLRKTQASRT